MLQWLLIKHFHNTSSCKFWTWSWCWWGWWVRRVGVDEANHSQIQVWPHAKRLWSLVATWAFPVSDVKDPKEPFHDSSCTDEKPKTWVGWRPLACLIANRALVLHGGIGQVGMGCGKIGNQPLGCQLLPQELKSFQNFEAKSICHFLTPGFSFCIHWWCPGWGDGMWGLSDIWNVARCGLGQQKRVRRSLHKWFSCDRPLPSEKILSKALFKQGWIYLNPIAVTNLVDEGIISKFHHFYGWFRLFNVASGEVFLFFFTFAHRRTVGKAGTFSCGTLPWCGWPSTTIPRVKIVTASLPGSSIFCGQTPSKMEWMQTQLPSVPTLRATQQSRRINLQGTRRVSEWKRGTIWTNQQNPSKSNKRNSEFI